MKAKKVTGLLLAFVMAFSMTACGNSTSTSADSAESSGSGEEAAQDQADSSERVPIRWLTTGDTAAEVIEDGDRIIEEINNRLGIDLTVEIVPEGNTEKVNVAMASGDFPDIVTGAYGTSATQQWIDDGMVISLNDYMDSSPDITAWLEDYEWSAQDGNYYGLPFITQYETANSLVIMRQDWLDNLGLSYPETLDEMKEVLNAFTFNDPDGNGQDDTYGISFALADRVKLEPIMFAFGLFWDDGIPDRDGTYKMYQKMSGYIPYITWLRDRYAEGVIDPEFITNKTSTHTEKFQAGTAGMITSHQAGAISKVKTQPNALDLYEYIAGPVDQETGELNIYNQLPIWGGYMIPADSPNVEKCLELLDYGNSQEGFQLMSIGIEGVHYNSYDPETQTIDRTEEQTAAYNSVGSTHFTFAYARHGMTCIIEGGDTPERVQTFHEQFDPVKESCNFTTVPAIRTPLYSSWEAENPDLLKEFQEMEVKYVVGEISLEEYEEFLNNKYFPAWEEAEAEYIKYMESLNQ